MKLYRSFTHFIQDASDRLQHQSYLVHPATWQSIDVSKKPEMATSEILNYSGSVYMPTTDLKYYQENVKPNLPWADEHFERERVSGEPINPGVTWKTWPWGNSADKFRTEGEQFSHSYAERYWPKFAGTTPGGRINDPHFREGSRKVPSFAELPRSGMYHKGIRYYYGDLNDVINHLLDNPLSRQAYLPIWFPEDTGVVHKERVPCSLGYQFIRRGTNLHINYWLRSCDFYRHFRDDIYLTVRLLLRVLERLQGQSDDWRDVQPGLYSMWITSLHLFTNDRKVLYGPEDRIPGRS